MSKTDEFIRQSKEHHGDKYDYSKTEYIHNLKEVVIICKEHGEFSQLPKTHKRGNGCIKCGIISRGNLRKSSTDEFIEKARNVHGDRYDYSNVNYTFARKPVTIICKLHGKFEQTPNGHLSKGAGCVKCATQINADRLRKTKEQFIDDANTIHGNKYDYTKVNYISASEKVVILCKEHGPFEQIPNNHLSKGSGCCKCAGTYKSNTEEFIAKAINVHGDRYDYSNVHYTTVMEKVLILCKDHGPFEQTPNGHLNGAGCTKCGYHMWIFSTDDFKRHAYQIHRDTYDYAESEYVQMNQKVSIRCKIHGLFEQTPSNHITHQQGCGKCGGHYKSNSEEFIAKAIDIHGDKYDYTKIEYITNSVNICILCKIHGEFEQTPATHLSGCGCVKCGRISMQEKQKTSLQSFIENAHTTHDSKYVYDNVIYINARTYVSITCPTHGDFKQIPYSHLRGCGCPLCCRKKYSAMQIRWLNFVQKYEAVHIEHAENGGEFPIPGTRFKADGYCRETNTIYEFHGDLWHGNPMIYRAEEVSYFGKTYGELYQKTVLKETKIKEMGFKLVVLWESEWNRINRIVGILQRNILKK